MTRRSTLFERSRRGVMPTTEGSPFRDVSVDGYFASTSVVTEFPAASYARNATT